MREKKITLVNISQKYYKRSFFLYIICFSMSHFFKFKKKLFYKLNSFLLYIVLCCHYTAFSPSFEATKHKEPIRHLQTEERGRVRVFVFTQETAGTRNWLMPSNHFFFLKGIIIIIILIKCPPIKPTIKLPILSGKSNRENIPHHNSFITISCTTSAFNLVV